jgi:Xaa-Pro aminopeptidase
MEASFYAHNRRRLIQQLKPSSLVALAGFGAMQRAGDEAFEFKQESNFWYLSGIAEPDWMLFIDVDSGEEWLIAQELNMYKRAFLGGLTAERASQASGIANIVEKREGKELLHKLLAKKRHVYTLLPQSTRVYGFQQNTANYRKLRTELRGKDIIDVRLPLAKLRAIKQPEELKAIQAAVDITIDGIEAVLKEIRQYKTENEIDARLYYEFRRRGAVHGFDPVIASGTKTCILHNPSSNDPINHSLLIDVGARVNNYTADITRTVPIEAPSQRWIEVYEAVERMHDQFLELLKPGAPARDALKQAYIFIGEEMRSLGIIDKVKLDYTSVFKYMPHAVGHGLGVDTHDPLGRPETFQENMVITDEVGVYLPDEGFGIRIENDIVITRDGARNMVARLPIALPELRKMLQ